MQFVESVHEAKSFIESLDVHSSIIHVYYQNNKAHPSNNQPVVLFAKVKSKFYAVSFQHPDAMNIPIEYINTIFKTNGKKRIFDRKRLKYHVRTIKNAMDVWVCEYLNTMTTFDIDYKSNSSDFRSIPIMSLFLHFKNLCLKVQESELYKELASYEHMFSTALYEIEKNGMYVEDFSLGDKSLVNKDNLVFTKYNMLTPTGRPSNSFGNVNYVALNKKTGDRDCFKSRFGDDGLLIMIDYESYHLRLIGNYLKYNLPDTSIHEYLGKIYHGKEILTEDEYELSKKITFNLIYGGIDDDIKNNVPFMKEISDYVEKVYSEFNKSGYIETWHFKRKLKPSFFGKKINSYKVFNYLLQSAETERNCKVLSEITSFLQNTKSKLILYTYDAFLFDVHRDEFSIFKNLNKIITTNNVFPVRTYIGNSYGNIREL